VRRRRRGRDLADRARSAAIRGSGGAREAEPLAGARRAGPRGRGLTDRLCPRPRILFVGINPSLRSAEVGHHFAGPGNPFWRLLTAARLVPEPLAFADDGRLPEFGLALTNIVPRATRSAAELAPAEYARGRTALAAKIARIRPRVVAFVGVTVYQRFFGSSSSGGAGSKPERIGAARVFVVPNPSGLNAAYPGFRDKLIWYRRLARYAAEM
jgi:double-stranded uracil-DNA glycosylase